MVAREMCDGEHQQVPTSGDWAVPAAARALPSAFRIQIAAGRLACCLALALFSFLAFSYLTF